MMGSSKYSRYEKLEKNIQDDNQGVLTSQPTMLTMPCPVLVVGSSYLECTGFIDDQQQTQSMIMQEQDQQLEEVGQTIGVLKQMGTMIGDELESQNQ